MSSRRSVHHSRKHTLLAENLTALGITTHCGLGTICKLQYTLIVFKGHPAVLTVNQCSYTGSCTHWMTLLAASKVNEGAWLQDSSVTQSAQTSCLWCCCCPWRKVWTALMMLSQSDKWQPFVVRDRWPVSVVSTWLVYPSFLFLHLSLQQRLDVKNADPQVTRSGCVRMVHIKPVIQFLDFRQRIHSNCFEFISTAQFLIQRRSTRQKINCTFCITWYTHTQQKM